VASDILVYGTDWCGLTHHLREYLMRSRFEYDYFDIDRDNDAQQFVLAMNDGQRPFPLVVVQHHVVTQPTVAILNHVIREHGLQPAIRTARPIAMHTKTVTRFRVSVAHVVNDNFTDHTVHCLKPHTTRDDFRPDDTRRRSGTAAAWAVDGLRLRFSSRGPILLHPQADRTASGWRDLASAIRFISDGLDGHCF